MRKRVVIYQIRGGVAVRSFDFGDNIYREFWDDQAYCSAVLHCINNKLDVLLLTDRDNGRKRRHTGSYR